MYQGISFIAIRVLSLYFFVKALLDLTQYTSLLELSSRAESQIMKNQAHFYQQAMFIQLLPFAVLIAAAFILWGFAEKFSTWFVMRKQEADTEPPAQETAVYRADTALLSLDIRHLQPTILFLLGIIFITIAIPQLFYVASELFFIQLDAFFHSPQLKIPWMGQLVRALIQFVIGILLILFARRRVK